jgi:hypothetical protein
MVFPQLGQGLEAGMPVSFVTVRQLQQAKLSAVGCVKFVKKFIAYSCFCISLFCIEEFYQYNNKKV